MTTSTNPEIAIRLSREIFMTWTSEAAECIFDAYGLRKACGSACQILIGVNYSDKQGEIIDQMHTIWAEARELDLELQAIASKAKLLHQRAMEALKPA